MEIGDKVQLRGGHIGTIVNINEFREPSMKYAVDIESFDDVVFCGDNDIIETIYSATQELELPIKKYIAENYVSKKKIEEILNNRILKLGSKTSHFYIDSFNRTIAVNFDIQEELRNLKQELLEESEE